MKHTGKKSLVGIFACMIAVFLFFAFPLTAGAADTEPPAAPRQEGPTGEGEDLLPESVPPKSSRGIVFDFSEGVCRVRGTASASTYLDLLGSESEVPAALCAGDMLRIEYETENSGVYFGIRAFNAENPDGVWLLKTRESTEFTVPDLSGCDGVSFRVTVSKTERELDLSVSPRVIRVTAEDDGGLLPRSVPPKSSHGVVLDFSSGVCHVKGTPTASSFLDLLGSKSEIPAALHAGDVLRIEYETENSGVYFGIRAFNAENPDGVWLLKTRESTEFTVPDLSVYDGAAFRVTVSKADRALDLSVSPRVIRVTAEDDGELIPQSVPPKSTHGVVFGFSDGVCCVKGTPTASSFLDLLGSKSEIPAALRAGDVLRIEYETENSGVYFGIRAFNAENPDGVWLLKTRESTEFTVPDLSGYDGAAFRINVSKADRELDLGVRLSVRRRETVFREPMLTIIDDDGDIHFMTDVVPLIRELGVSISTAVTPTRIGSKTRWMDWDDIARCASQGAEVLSHTYYHYSGTEIRSVSDADIVEGYRMARKILEEKGYPANILVYSSSTGSYQRVQRDAAEVYDCAIRIGGNQVNSADSDRYALSRCRIDYAETEGKTSWNRDDMKEYVDTVVEQGGWEIMMFHTSNSLWRQRVVLDEAGEPARDEAGNVIPMTDAGGQPVMDTAGRYPTMGTEVYLPMLRDVILYAQERGAAVVTAQYAYQRLFG